MGAPAGAVSGRVTVVRPSRVIVRTPSRSALGSTPSLAVVPVRTAVVSPRETCCRTGTPTGWLKMFAELQAYPAGAAAGEGCGALVAWVAGAAQPAINVMAATVSRHRRRGTLDRRGNAVVGCLDTGCLDTGCLDTLPSYDHRPVISDRSAS